MNLFRSDCHFQLVVLLGFSDTALISVCTSSAYAVCQAKPSVSSGEEEKNKRIYVVVFGANVVSDLGTN